MFRAIGLLPLVAISLAAANQCSPEMRPRPDSSYWKGWGVDAANSRFQPAAKAWLTETAREYETVNGVAVRGGAISGPGPVVAEGMVFAGSGYGIPGGRPGHVLLAFAPGE